MTPELLIVSVKPRERGNRHPRQRRLTCRWGNRLSLMEKTINPHLLILLEAPLYRSELSGILTAAGYTVRSTHQPAQALAWLTDDAFDVMIFDLDSDQVDSVAFMQSVIKIQPDLQMIILTGKPALRTAIAAIRVRAFDYLVKPVDVAVVVDSVSRSLESLAALKTQLARLVREGGKAASDGDLGSGPDSPGWPSVIIVPPYRLDYTRRQVLPIGDESQAIDLSRGETTVLACLMANSNQTLTTSQLARLAWGYEMDTHEAGELVRPYIHRLRRKLELNPDEPSLIITVRGQGYLFFSDHRAPVESED
ncbi:MAG: hypothetical protein DCC51_11000 [Anaerolineae bacterium]|nr:MAG: hypothetical protein DCC51_11000 [Anaerolineae bacterium]